MPRASRGSCVNERMCRLLAAWLLLAPWLRLPEATRAAASHGHPPPLRMRHVSPKAQLPAGEQELPLRCACATSAPKHRCQAGRATALARSPARAPPRSRAHDGLRSVAACRSALQTTCPLFPPPLAKPQRKRITAGKQKVATPRESGGSRACDGQKCTRRRCQQITLPLSGDCETTSRLASFGPRAPLAPSLARAGTSGRSLKLPSCPRPAGWRADRRTTTTPRSLRNTGAFAMPRRA